MIIYETLGGGCSYYYTFSIVRVTEKYGCQIRNVRHFYIILRLLDRYRQSILVFIFYLKFSLISYSQNTFPPNAPQIQCSINILTRISLHKDQVSYQTLGNTSSVGEAKTSGRDACGGAKSLEGRESTFIHKKKEFMMQGKTPCSS
jgi:hypothetical protein